MIKQFLGLFSLLIVGLSPTPTSLPHRQLINNFEHGNRTRQQITLTFDADMTPSMKKQLNDGRVKSWYNQKIIETLRQKNIPATIFLTGMWAELYPNISKELAKDPLFEIGNHSYSHPSFSGQCFGLTQTKNKKYEIDHAQEVITKITGVTPKYFRFPGGCHDQTDVSLANSLGLTVVGWDDASGDPFNQNSQNILNRLQQNTQNGSIIVFHLHGNRNAPESAVVLPQIIDYLKNRGFTFVPLSTLIANSTTK